MDNIKIDGPIYLYVNGMKGTKINNTVELSRNIFADYDEEDNIIGIEIITDVEIESTRLYD